MDTPGVLSRPDGERNEMEALTLASMQHLPTAVVFVMDLSGYSGLQSSLENQVFVVVTVLRCFVLQQAEAWLNEPFDYGSRDRSLVCAEQRPTVIRSCRACPSIHMIALCACG